MVKKIILATTIAATLMLSGCGSADAEGESRLAAQNAIDTGTPGEAIKLLETTPISDMNTTQKKAFLATLSDSTKTTLASAYMSKAGLNLTDVVSKMSSASSTDSNSSDSFATLAKSLVGDANKTVDNVKNIDSAIAYYESIAAATSASPSRALGKTQIDKLSADIKLYLGMAYLSKVTMLLGMLGDVATLQGGGTLDNDFKASAKAIDCFYAGHCTDVDYKEPYAYRDSTGALIQTVDLYDVNLSGTIYYRLASHGTKDNNNSGSLILADYPNLTTVNDTSLPFGPEYKLEDQLVDAINGAFNALTSAIPDDLKKDIDKYKAKIDTNKDNTISVTEIKAYINK